MPESLGTSMRTNSKYFEQGAKVDQPGYEQDCTHCGYHNASSRANATEGKIR